MNKKGDCTSIYGDKYNSKGYLSWGNTMYGLSCGNGHCRYKLLLEFGGFCNLIYYDNKEEIL